MVTLCSRVKAPNLTDAAKLDHLVKYLNGTRTIPLTLSANDTNIITWFVDAAFAVHPDFKSHTGGNMTMGEGAVISISKKQKMNTQSSTEAELVAADDCMGMILWTRLFLEAQGYQVNDNILFQDNQSTILLQKNGKSSSSKRTRHLNIRYFFIKDQYDQGNLTIKYCSTDKMLADYMSKPQQGQLFKVMRKALMNLPNTNQ